MRSLAWRYLAPQWPLLIGMTLLLPGSIGLQLAGPRVVAAFLDGAAAGAPLGDLLRLATRSGSIWRRTCWTSIRRFMPPMRRANCWSGSTAT